MESEAQQKSCSGRWDLVHPKILEIEKLKKPPHPDKSAEKISSVWCYNEFS